MQRIVGSLASLAVVLFCCGDARAQSSPTARAQRIGIGPIGPAGLPADLRIRLEDAAATGLKASGAEVVTAAELSRARTNAALGSCSDLVCEQRLAQVTDTRYWLRGTCQLDTSTYRLHLELVDARSGAVVVARDDTCDICTEADAAETANVAASALKAALGRAPAAGGGPATPAVATTAAKPATPVSAVSPTLLSGATDQPKDTAADSGQPMWRRLLPWAAFVAAAGAAAGGIYYLAVNGQRFGCQGVMPDLTCHEYNDTVWRQGVPLLAASVALAATGIVLLTIGGRSGPGASSSAQASAPPPAKLALTPAGLSLFGAF